MGQMNSTHNSKNTFPLPEAQSRIPQRVDLGLVTQGCYFKKLNIHFESLIPKNIKNALCCRIT